MASPLVVIAVLILSCHDGDTCRADREILLGQDRIRLANADTPEIDGQCGAEIKQAIMAREYTRSMVVGQTVTLTAVEPDKYPKRVDAHVRLPDGRDLGDPLIAAGLAQPSTSTWRSSLHASPSMTALCLLNGSQAASVASQCRQRSL